MTQHALMEDTQADIQTMKNLRNFVVGFMVFTALIALGVTLFAP